MRINLSLLKLFKCNLAGKELPSDVNLTLKTIFLQLDETSSTIWKHPCELVILVEQNIAGNAITWTNIV